MLETHQQLNFDYFDDVVKSDLGIDKIGVLDPQEFVGKSWTSEKQDDLWVENYTENKPIIIPDTIREDTRNKTVILIGGSPALEKNWEALKEVDDSFILVCCTTSLRFLLNHGIKPHYCALVDAQEHIVKDIEGCDTKDITLISSPFASPRALALWEGEIRFYLLGGGEKYNKLIREDWKGQADIDIGGGNVLSTAYLWAYKYLSCRHFIVCGMSLCYYNDYYLEGREYGDAGQDNWKGKVFAQDMYGEYVHTTPALCMYKTWMETYVKFAHKPEYSGSFTNSTEDGILGVLPEIVETDGLKIRTRPTHVPWISVIPLSTSIRGHKLRLLKEN